MLIQRGLLTPLGLEQVLESQVTSRNRFATECFVLGMVEEESLLSALSAQVGVPGVQLTRLVLPVRFLDVVSEQDASRNAVLPVRVDSDRVFLAMADPDDERLMSEISFTSGRRVMSCVALHGVIGEAIRDAYAAREGGDSEYRGARAGSATDNSVSFFVFAEELSRVPRELIESVGNGEGKGVGEPGGSCDSAAQNAAESPGPDSGSDERRGPVGRVSDASRSGSGRARVLVVDDEPELRRLICRTLRRQGYQVEEASRGLEALNRIRDRPPDLVLLDAMLPEVHGFDICKKIKSSDRYGDIPVIMISSFYRGWRFARDLEEAYGVAAFLEKPFELQALVDAVDRVLDGAHRAGNRAGRQGRLSSAAKRAMQAGVQRFRSGDLDGAIETYREGIHVDPLSAKLHYQLAILYLKKKGMTYQAMQELEEAVTLEPDMFAALRNLAILYQSKGFRNKAIDLWERALRCSPDEETKDHIRKHVLSLI